MFPDRPHRDDEYVHFINDYMPMVLLVSFMLPVASICKDIVSEKEKKLKVPYTRSAGVIVVNAAGDAGDASPEIFGQPGTKCLISPKV